jgi:hypothetical protein
MTLDLGKLMRRVPTNWFYYKLHSADGEGSKLCSELPLLGNMTAKCVVTDVSCAVVDSLKCPEIDVGA